jgi:hypothetical protein
MIKCLSEQFAETRETDAERCTSLRTHKLMISCDDTADDPHLNDDAVVYESKTRKKRFDSRVREFKRSSWNIWESCARTLKNSDPKRSRSRLSNNNIQHNLYIDKCHRT